MINEQAPQEKTSFFKKFALPLSLLFAIAWWVSGWFVNPTPSWWSSVFTGSLVIVFCCVWMEFKQVIKNLRSQSENMDEGYSDNPFDDSRNQSNPQAHASQSVSHQSQNQSGIKNLLTPQHIRQFASIEDGRAHGWVFDEQIGTFDGKPLYARAHRTEDQKIFVFDGLVRDTITAFIQESVVMFGRIRFKLIEEPKKDEQEKPSVETVLP